MQPAAQKQDTPQLARPVPAKLAECGLFVKTAPAVSHNNLVSLPVYLARKPDRSRVSRDDVQIHQRYDAFPRRISATIPDID